MVIAFQPDDRAGVLDLASRGYSGEHGSDKVKKQERSSCSATSGIPMNDRPPSEIQKKLRQLLVDIQAAKDAGKDYEILVNQFSREVYPRLDAQAKHCQLKFKAKFGADFSDFYLRRAMDEVWDYILQKELRAEKSLYLNDIEPNKKITVLTWLKNQVFYKMQEQSKQQWKESKNLRMVSVRTSEVLFAQDLLKVQELLKVHQSALEAIQQKNLGITAWDMVQAILELEVQDGQQFKFKISDLAQKFGSQGTNDAKYNALKRFWSKKVKPYLQKIWLDLQ
jgi:hypothetical protein